ncbi:efflux RND transporter permease subunit [Skermanella rosea]|uniref:efflux RND transporter permease subunit n=1 Tax=Skermanella rosea TaxID=1817965 RepID=UPI001931F3BF|nr:efflux RND transporter permease subunit [Skermanella rosea]UEM03903.1 efflux RND transporter permease subunit [Skermanella rosea]
MIAWFARHPTAANLLMLFLLVIGLVTAPSLRRETFPDFTLSQVQIQVPYPGASAEEVEEAVCQRIEDAVAGVSGVDEVRCESREGLAAAIIDMVEGGNPDRFLEDVKAEVEAITTFPDLVERPVIKRLNLTDRVVSIAITGPMSVPDLKIYAEGVRERLLRLPEVSEATLTGFSQRQIRVELDQGALRAHGLSVADVAGIIGRQSLDQPAGTLETEERSLTVRFADERRTVRQLTDLVVIGGTGGGEVRLGAIAAITERFELDEAKTLFDGERAAMLRVTKTKQQDTLRVMAAVRGFVEQELRTAPPGVGYALTQDVSSIVQDRLDMLTGNAFQGIALVFLSMWLFFSLRYSFWVAMGLPVALAGTVFAMQFMGLSINMITMVGLLIALGLLMDDAIVIAENVATKLAAGLPPMEAVIDGTREVASGVFASYVTTVCVFGPLILMQGDIGKVMAVLPVVLIIALTVSIVEAFLILPHHLAKSIPPGGERRNAVRVRLDRGFDFVRDRLLGGLVDRAVEWRYLTLGLVICAVLVSAAMLAGGTVKFRAFPQIDGNVLEARILLPQGTPLARTEEVVDRVTGALDRVAAHLAPRQPDGAALVRAVTVRFNENQDAYETGPHLASVSADLLTAERRDGTIDEITALWRAEIGPLPDVLALTFKEAQVGPGGLPIDIRLAGGDLDRLKAASLELQDWLGRYRGVEDLSDDLRPGKPEMGLRLREGIFGQGLDSAALATQLRAAYFGQTAAELQVGSESIEVDVRLAAADRTTLADLEDFPVTLPDGSQAPLRSIAVLEPDRGYARIGRIDGRRTVIVRGEIDTRIANANEVIADTRARFLPELSARYPEIDITLEGQEREQGKTGESLKHGFMIGLFGIFVLLSLQFRSYVEPVIVMVAIPMALIGVVWGHWLAGFDVSMPSMIGFVSLAGIVVNDSILLVEFVKLRAREGRDVVSAARIASRQRFRAVLLTSLTTIAGLLPLLAERSLQAQVLQPLVVSLVFGLLASTVLVLLVVPSLYAILHDFGLTALAREDREAAAAAMAAAE